MAKVKETYTKRQYKGQILIDSKEQSVARQLGIKTTCEVFLIDGAGTLIYRGAIDDQYGIGFVKKAPENNYLADAIDSLLKKEIPKVRLTTAPGCLVEFEKNQTAKSEITFHKDISRVLQAHCQRCHRDGGVGPFNLITYGEVKERRKMLKYVVSKKLMPPWFAHGGGPWVDNYDLSEPERAMILEWIAGGTPEGNKKDTPEAMSWPKEWLLSNPDLVVPLDNKISVKAEGFMKYINVNVKVPTREDKWISAVEIRTTNSEVLHHALVFHLGSDKSKFRTADTSGVRGFFAGYVPGNQLNVYPEGSGKKLEAGTYLRFQLHYTPNGTAVKDQVSIAFKFHDKKPENVLETKSAFNNRFLIPPGDGNYEVKARHKFLQDGYLVGFSPHAHLRGKAFKYELVAADGSKKTLVDIPRYDFNWQITYQYQQPLSVKAGSYLEVTAHFDNSADNPANPNPKKAVRFGDQTEDEMMIGYFEWIQATGSDSIYMSDELKNEVESLVEQMKMKKLSQKQAGQKLFIFLMKQVREGKMTQQEATNYFQTIAKKYGERK
ncbi:MAG: hypothetical protein NE328_16740 [Lentisphaeraceae bacterium]|nr:hypothetical protein [Lentisphaeraceae bacterium]